MSHSIADLIRLSNLTIPKQDAKPQKYDFELLEFTFGIDYVY